MRFNFYLFKFVLCIIIPLYFGGCAVTLSPIQGLLYTGVKTPVTYKSAKSIYEYQTLGEVEGNSSATSILGIIATGDASANAAYKNALLKYPEADGLVDVCVDQTYSSFLGIFASYKTTLNAKAVKWTGEIQPVASPIIAARAQADSGQISSEPYTQPVTRQAQSTTPDFVSQIPVFLTRGDLGHNINLALSNLAGEPGGVGFRFGYKMRRTGFSLTFNPAISYGSLFKKDSKNYSYQEYDYQQHKYVTKQYNVKLENTYKVIPFEFNFALNAQYFSKLTASLPPELNPFVEAGLTYYIWQSSVKETYSRYGWANSWEGDWDFFELGLNIGLGAEYYFKPNLAIAGCLKRHIVFDKEIDFWNWQVGLSFSPIRKLQ